MIDEEVRKIDEDGLLAQAVHILADRELNGEYCFEEPLSDFIDEVKSKINETMNG